MQHRTKAALLAAAIVVAGPAAAQATASKDSGIQTETQERMKQKSDDTIWNVIGMFGLIGLFGFSRPSDNDGYTDDPI